jgi:hypothetical protein
VKRYTLVAVRTAGLFFCAGLLLAAAARHADHDKNAFAPDTISWRAAPPVVRPGAQFAVLEGDPTASKGDFTIRLKMPDGFRIGEHLIPLASGVTENLKKIAIETEK